MASPVCMKRMRKEREKFENQNSQEFFVHFKDEDLLNFVAYIVGPEDSLYKHKLLKFKFEIPPNYPLVPPKVKFVQYSCDRIHPNLYVDGKVCLSILGTWSGEPWATAMNVESVLITIRSLLDNEPYKHEPGQRNNPSFNSYVQYAGWQCLLLDHLKHEQEAPAKAFIDRHMAQHGSEMIEELQKQQQQHSTVQSFRSVYSPMRGYMKQDYASLLVQLKQVVSSYKPAKDEPNKPVSDAAKALSNTDKKTFSWNPFKRKASILANEYPETKSNPVEVDQDHPKKRPKDIVDLT